MGFQVAAAGANAKVPPAVPACSPAKPASGGSMPTRIQPFYTGLLARDCGAKTAMAMEGEAVVVTAQ